MTGTRALPSFTMLLAALTLLASATLACSGKPASPEGERPTAAPPVSGDGSHTAAAATVVIDAAGLHRRLREEGPGLLLVDVREPEEFREAHIEGATLAPLSTTASALEGVEKDREIVLVCRSGRRSEEARKALAADGFTRVQNMEGGMLAWEKLGYPVVRLGPTLPSPPSRN